MLEKYWSIVGVTLIDSLIIAEVVSKVKGEDKRIDDNNPYLNIPAIGNRLRLGEQVGIQKKTVTKIIHHNPSVYEKYIKSVIDKMLAFGGMVTLFPLYGMISLAIIIDDPGPVFFTQKRVGKNKHFFMLHKFRTMKTSSPHDVPTHQLSNPERYITRVGRILRKTSLDELPQIWDIFRGKMSIIGPRPALWNQNNLVAEREKYGANNVLPGLTGWAQINGRDELEIPVKAKMDGEYVEKLGKGGFRAFAFDCNCFLRTIFSVLRKEGVVEGGTGTIHIDTIKSNDKKTFYSEDDYQLGDKK